jgi:hypothetical protein
MSRAGTDRRTPTVEAEPRTDVADALVRLTEPADVAYLQAWRAETGDEDIAASCAVTRILDRIIDRWRGRRHHVLVSSFPKSASTFLHEVLTGATGFRTHLLHATGQDNERNIEPHRVPLFMARHTVSQEHMRATRRNTELLRRMGVRPVVLVRNLFDVLVSSGDHAVSEGAVGPVSHAPPDLPSWPPDRRLDYLARMAAAWYLSLYASWIDASKELDVLWITYDEVVSDTAHTARRVLEHSGVEADDEAIRTALARVDPKRTRFNKGVAGRGAQAFKADQVNMVRMAGAAYGPGYDFSRIGL